MKISTKGRYALRLMIDLAQQGEGARVSISEIAERQSVPTKYMEQIVAPLVRVGLVKSFRGIRGGYSLVRLPSEYSAGEILRAIEGNLSPVPCLGGPVSTCPRKGNCDTLPFWQGLYKAINDYVDTATLADLAFTDVHALG